MKQMMSKKTILLTRSHRENLLLENSLKPFSQFHIINLPIITHEVIDIDFANLKTYSNFIITSKFAAELVSNHIQFQCNIFVVGEESANILKQNFNIRIVKTYFTVQDLILDLSNHKSEYLYLSGNIISQDIPFAKRMVIYNTNYLDHISEETINLINNNAIDLILFYSKNTALQFINLFKYYNLLQKITNSDVIAISKDVGQILAPYVKSVSFPKYPNAHAMIDLIFGKV